MAVQYNLIKQDVFEGLKTLESDSYDLCIVDPPYGASSKHNWDYGKKEKVAGFGGEWNLENEAWDLLSQNDSFLNTFAWLILREWPDSQSLYSRPMIYSTYYLNESENKKNVTHCI